MSDATPAGTRVRDAFRDQARSCDELGSPFTARLCRLVADRLATGSKVGTHVLGWHGDPTSKGDSVPLRLAGALHALVLSGRDEELEASYPPNRYDDEALWQAITRAMEQQAGFILDRLISAPQTNEVRRSAALLPGFLTVAQLFGKPLLLSEVGASAGLNLHWDRYRYALAGNHWGNEASAVAMHLNGREQGRPCGMSKSSTAPGATSIPSIRPIARIGFGFSPMSGPTSRTGSTARGKHWSSPPFTAAWSSGRTRSTG
ncbi:hypothetical protein ACVI1N_003141 [Sinorhizobium medicae]